MTEGFVKRAVELIRKANNIYIIGNGGAASMADHLACDLLKNAGKRAISLCSNSALMTAIGNDIGFEDIFLEQLKVLYEDNDLLIAMSTSGKSQNVVKAAEYTFNKKGEVMTIGGFGGGKLADYATLSLILDSHDTQECENLMNEVCHQLYKGLVKVE